MSSSGCGVIHSIVIIFSLSSIATWCLTANALAAADKVLDFSNHGDNGSPSRTEESGKQWAILVAGSRGYRNYRHQADVCHAYQILKRGGLEDENIIVFMYDDIASNPENPRPGVIINRPNGTDVYKGVPKDYTGDIVNPENLYAAILGNTSVVNGGSGKVLDSGPNDHIFIYYSDHGSPGVLGMPAGGYVYAEDLIDVLKKKHASKGYKSMVLYVEACEAGSIFQGLLPENLNIYATTASNAEESSYGTYCPGEEDVPFEYSTCLGDLYSVSWMEDCDKQDLNKETLGKQYEIVRSRTNTSHVMQYGDLSHRHEHLSTYMGEAPTVKDSYTSPTISTVNISQSDADILHLQYKFQRAPTGSHQKLEAQKELLDEIAQRKLEDYQIYKIGELLFGNQKSSQILMNVRPSGQPLVDDWDCLKMFESNFEFLILWKVSTYESFCGPFSTYGMRYTRAIANICNAGVTKDKIIAALHKTCSKIPQTLDPVLHEMEK